MVAPPANFTWLFLKLLMSGLGRGGTVLCLAADSSRPFSLAWAISEASGRGILTWAGQCLNQRPHCPAGWGVQFVQILYDLMKNLIWRNVLFFLETEEVVAWWCWWWSFLEGSGMPDPVVAPLDTGRAEVDLRTGRAEEVGEGMLDPPPWRTEADWVVGFLLEGVGILLPGRGMLEGFATSVLDNLLWGS